MKSPNISVLMSAYNCDQYINYSIDSILDQSFRNFEFIIIDDGSTDNTLSIIEKYKNIDNRIILIKNRKNIGLSASLNKGVEIVKGKYSRRFVVGR